MDPANRSKYIIAAIAFVIIAVAVYFLFIFQKGEKDITKKSEVGEQKQIQEIGIADRPFVTLTPTADGAEIIISIENMGKFDAVEYELTYLADNPQSAGVKITRGATGTDINTKDTKYKKSILLGTASRGVRSPDTGITDGKLVMHMFIGEEEFLSETDWTFEKVGSIAGTTITDKSGNFEIEIPALGKDYFVIIADTVGVPPNARDFKPEQVALPVYGTFSIASSFKTTGTVSVKVEGQEPTLYAFDHNEGSFTKLATDFKNSTLTADVSSFDTFVVVSPE